MFSFFRYCPRCTTSTSSISSNNSTSSCGRSSKASYSRKGCWSRQLEVYPGHSRWSDDNVHPKVKSLCCNCSRKLLHHLLNFSILTICTSWKLYSLKVEMARTTENMYLLQNVLLMHRRVYDTGLYIVWMFYIFFHWMPIYVNERLQFSRERGVVWINVILVSRVSKIFYITEEYYVHVQPDNNLLLDTTRVWAQVSKPPKW